MNQLFSFILIAMQSKKAESSEKGLTNEQKTLNHKIATCGFAALGGHDWYKTLADTGLQKNPSIFTLDCFFVIVSEYESQTLLVEIVDRRTGGEGGIHTTAGNNGDGEHLSFADICSALNRRRNKMASICCSAERELSLVLGRGEGEGDAMIFTEITHQLPLTAASQIKCCQILKKFMMLVQARRA